MPDFVVQLNSIPTLATEGYAALCMWTINLRVGIVCLVSARWFKASLLLRSRFPTEEGMPPSRS